VRREVGVPVLTDVHDPSEVASASEVADCLQIPAFLSRQSALLEAAARTGRAVNVKKGQFLAPDDMRQVIEKITAAGGQRLLLTERGTTFGYHDLVVDFRGLVVLRELGWPVVYDATHSLQRPGGEQDRGRPALRVSVDARRGRVRRGRTVLRGRIPIRRARCPTPRPSCRSSRPRRSSTTRCARARR
jgi:3-deoxy-8-phosphooctulonate synthase